MPDSRADRRATAPTHGGRRARGARALIGDDAGAVYTEYTVILVLVGLVAAAATVALGVPLLRLFRYAQTMLLLPFP